MYETTDGYLGYYFGIQNEEIRIKEHRLNALLKYSLSEVFNTKNTIHHKNHCKIDNRIENLELMTVSEHKSYHNKINNPLKKEDVKNKISNLMKNNKNACNKKVNVDELISLRKQGYTYEEIEKITGIPSSTAHRRIKKEMMMDR